MPLAPGQVAYTFDQKIASRGEATVYTVREFPNLVAKIYHAHIPVPTAKLTIMTRMQTPDLSIAWPVDIIYDMHGATPIGFVMPKVRNAVTIDNVYNPVTRIPTFTGFNTKYLVALARNLAYLFQKLHRSKLVVGDVSDQNLLVDCTAAAYLIDADSMQVPTPTGVLPCTGRTPEYTPAELQDADLRVVIREQHCDNFGLAVLIFRLLMEGVHPFAITWTKADAPDLPEKIITGTWAYDTTNKLQPPKAAPLFSILPPAIQELFRRCFNAGHRNPSARPSAKEWMLALTEALGNLSQCRAPRKTNHFFSNHLSACPWCAYERQHGYDPFPDRQP